MSATTARPFNGCAGRLLPWMTSVNARICAVSSSMGIVSTIHVTLAEGWNEARAGDVLRGAYANERFVRLLPSGAWPSTLHVERTNFCDIGWAGRDGRLIVCSAIDNLVKGAAGQAVQAMNAALGWDEALGLEGL